MLWEDNYLAHYGIKGQKWGIRRYQNKNGTLTEEGCKRYSSLKSAKSKVKEKLSNKVSRFVKDALDIEKIQKRGDISRSEAEVCAKLANKLFDQASRIEPQITKDVVKAVSDSGCSMYGLDKRLKQPTSIASKIGANAKEDGVSFEDASKSIKDVIRYTSVSEDSGFVVSYSNIKQALADSGYTETRCKNYFSLYKEGKVKHKSVQCIYVDADGHPFEIQFQTVASQAVKDLKIPLYEEVRNKSTSPTRKREIERLMEDLAEQVSFPKGVMSIKSHG